MVFEPDDSRTMNRDTICKFGIEVAGVTEQLRHS